MAARSQRCATLACAQQHCFALLYAVLCYRHAGYWLNVLAQCLVCLSNWLMADIWACLGLPPFKHPESDKPRRSYAQHHGMLESVLPST